MSSPNESFPPGSVAPQNPPSAVDELPYDQRPQVPVTYVREQYKIVERKKLVVTATAGMANNYIISTKGAAIAMITTDSVIQYDVQDISADSPQMAGTTTTYDRIVIPLERQDDPKILYFVLVLGGGNVWILIGA